MRRPDPSLGLLVASAADAIIGLTLEGIITGWNAGAIRLFGYSTEQATGASISLLVPEGQQDETLQLLKSVARGEPVEVFETLLRAESGELRDVSIALSPIVDLTGQVAGASIIAREVAPRRREEGPARSSNDHFVAMADNAPMMIWMSDVTKKCVWFNRPWLEFTGRTMEQELGEGWSEGVHPDDFTHCLETYISHFDARLPFAMEYRLRRNDGAYRWILDYGAPCYDPSQLFVGYIGSCIDITDRKQVEAERDKALLQEQAARNEAERIGRMKDEFLATLSHELRTPLTSILGWAHVLRQNHPPREEFMHGLETIERNARLQAQVIDDLLDMSRIISGKLRLDVQRVHLDSVISSAIESVRPASDAKRIRLQSVLDPLAGPVTGDPYRLQQIVWNLLSNAIKFTPNGGRVQVFLERVNSHVEITVSDTGQGIEPDFLPYVFDRFRQGDSSLTRRQGGLGLGLGIARQLVELHGGSVYAKSPGPGQGATFIVMLPLTVVHESSDDDRRVHPRSAGRVNDLTQPSLRGIRVLVVDDEPDARELVQLLLEGSEATVEVAASAFDAYEAIRRHPPHVLLSDIGLPDEDGYALIEKVRALPAEAGGAIPAVALTAFARAEDRRRAMLAGFQLHLAKPVEPAELIAVVANVAGLTGRHRRSN